MSKNQSAVPGAPNTRRTIKRVEVRNKQFAAAAPAQRRVMIAEDVLKHLKSGQYDAQRIWCQFGRRVRGDLQTLLKKKEVGVCEVCALGALFLSAVRFRDNCLVGDSLGKANYISGDQIICDLKEFPIGQRRLIEAVFEGGCGRYHWDDLPAKQSITAQSFYFDDTDGIAGLHYRERMIVIMKNIIANNGTFKP